MLPSQRKALAAMKGCRSSHSPLMKAGCSDCHHVAYIPHSCGHRNCPHCQAHESQQWIERQCRKQLPVNYFMITFTLPKELRPLAWSHQRIIYRLLFECAWDTLNTFSLNDKQLSGTAGLVAVLHTHSRRLDYHPHLHTIMPAGAIDRASSLWRKKSGRYLFNHKALANVFRAKMLTAINREGLTLPTCYPAKWVVDCKQVGRGDKAFVYLGRYLYRGVIQEKDILRCHDGKVTFRYKDSKTGRNKTRTLPGADFIRLILQHVLPRRFRRTRDYGLLHSNSKIGVMTIQWLRKLRPIHRKSTPRPTLKCCHCGGRMHIIETRIIPITRAMLDPHKMAGASC